MTEPRHWALGRANCAWVVECAGDVGLPVGRVGLRGDPDDRMVRRYAECMADANTALHRLSVSSALGTVPLSAAAVQERVRGQLERGEVTMAKIRADYARYCE